MVRISTKDFSSICAIFCIFLILYALYRLDEKYSPVLKKPCKYQPPIIKHIHNYQFKHQSIDDYDE